MKMFGSIARTSSTRSSAKSLADEILDNRQKVRQCFARTSFGLDQTKIKGRLLIRVDINLN